MSADFASWKVLYNLAEYDIQLLVESLYLFALSLETSMPCIPVCSNLQRDSCGSVLAVFVLPLADCKHQSSRVPSADWRV
jgi:hypothetical protein